MPASTTTATILEGVLTVTSNGLPDPALAGDPLGSGNFPNSPNNISAQEYNYEFTYRGGTNTSNPQAANFGALGIALNGVILAAPTAADGPLPGTDDALPPNFQWNAVYNGTSYGVDKCGGHPEQNGSYHYHSGEFLVNCWANGIVQSNSYFSSSHYEGNYFRHPDGHSKIVGTCFDGYPVYGPFGYKIADDNDSGTKRLASSYRVLTTPPAGRNYSYAQKFAGTFVQDYEFVNGLGDLDINNGRYAVTPEFPGGTWAYFITLDEDNDPVYPYIFGPQTKQQRPS